MRRLARAAVAATSLALVATGCGVQPTGVNIAQAGPFSASGTSSSQEPSQSAAQYQMVLYFIPATNGLPRQSVRYVTKPITGVGDLLEQLKSPDDPTLVTWVPQDLQLVPTSNAHQYAVQSEEKLNSAAQEQLACTFSYYWRQHPDPGAEPSISFILPGSFAGTTWNDCTYLLGPAAKANAIAPSGN